VRRLGLFVLLLVLAAPGPALAQQAGPQVVVVGAAGLRWDDVGKRTPTLAALAARAAVGALSVKALPAVSCPADGWLTLGAGARAGTGAQGCGSALPAYGNGLARRNADSRDGARLGALAQALDGLSAEGPGARLAAAPVGGGDGRVRLVDAGTVSGRVGDAGRGQAAADVDAVLARELSALPTGADLLVVGLSEAPGDGLAHLHVALATGPAFPPGTLRSASTGRTGYVQLVDVAPTVLDLLGVPVPDTVVGRPWRSAGRSLGIGALVDLDVRATEGKRATVPFYVVVLGAELALLLAVRSRPRVLRVVALAGVAVPGASYAAMLVPWWRTGTPLAVLVAVVAGVAAATGLLASRARHGVGAVAGGTALLLVADLVTGAHLQLESPAGYSSLVAGRFTGIGNVAFGVYAASALLATTALAAGRRRPALWVAGAGLVAVAVDGAPPWGSDVGGVLALLPAFAVLALLLTGARVSAPRGGAALLGGGLVVTAFALADYARPAADRTHLGRFVEQVRDGTAGQVLRRKAEAVLGLLFHSPVTAALPLAVAAAVYLVLRPPPPLQRAFAAVPAFRHALVAVGVASAVGFAVNDSGAAVPALALVLVLPATVAVAAGVAAGRRGAGSP